MFLDVFGDGLDVYWTVLVHVRGVMKVWERTNHPPIKVLHPPLLGNVARDAEVEEDVVKRRVSVWIQAAEHHKPPAIVNNLRDLDETAA